MTTSTDSAAAIGLPESTLTLAEIARLIEAGDPSVTEEMLRRAGYALSPHGVFLPVAFSLTSETSS